MKRKRGRPPTEPEGVRDAVVTVRMRPEQRTLIQRAALKIGLSISSFLRMSGLERAHALTKPRQEAPTTESDQSETR